MLPIRFNKVEDRVSLHELLRIGVQRGEDLTLLHGMDFVQHHSSASLKLISDCKIREEIRQSREDSVLRSLSLSPSSSTSSLQATMQSASFNRVSSPQATAPLEASSSSSPSLHISDSERAKALAQIQSEIRRHAQPLPLPPSHSQSGSRPSSSLSHRPLSTRGKVLTPTTSSTNSPYSSRPSSSSSSFRPSSSQSRTNSPYGSRQIQGVTSDQNANKSSSSSSLPLPPTNPLTSHSHTHEESKVNGKGGTHIGGSRFHQLLRLHEILVRNLEQHKSSGGQLAAASALAANCKHARKIFQDFIEEVESVLSTKGPSRQKGVSQAPGVLLWTLRLLQLGQLGLTAADLDRLSVIRSSMAARSIQRFARPWLRRVRLRRSVEAAHKQSMEMMQMVISSSAVVIQSAWRALEGRREAKRRMQLKRINRVELLKMKLAAIKIQRFYRLWRRRRRVRDALMKAPTSSRLTSDPSPNEIRAAITIQSWIRGWRVRKSKDLWWEKRLMETRSNRQLASMWRHHHSRLAASLPLLHELVGTIIAEDEAISAALANAERERQEFESRWAAWISSHLNAAMSEPLPRGWIPMSDAEGIKFLNTKTRELHLFHPSVNALRPHAAEQREAAESRQAEREQAVISFTDRVKAESQKRQQQILQSLKA